jgi:hypothetical protein
LIPREHMFADAVTLPDLLKTAGLSAIQLTRVK